MNALPGSVDVRSRAERADELRAAMTRELQVRRDTRSDTVAAAFGTVPRHLFAPEARLEAACSAGEVVITKRDEHGFAISSVSAPQIQAMMLEQAGRVRGCGC